MICTHMCIRVRTLDTHIFWHSLWVPVHMCVCACRCVHACALELMPVKAEGQLYSPFHGVFLLAGALGFLSLPSALLPTTSGFS